MLMNSTSIGMGESEGQSPVSKQALAHYQLVFDAIYTPLRTQLIQVFIPIPSTCHIMGTYAKHSCLGTVHCAVMQALTSNAFCQQLKPVYICRMQRQRAA